MKRQWLRLAFGMAAGALVGYAYYHFIGCRSGTCPLTSNPWITTLYGIVIGAILTFPSKRKREP